MLTAIWTIFALICCGFVLARKGFPSNAFWPSAERLNYYILVPALLVSNLANAPIRDPRPATRRYCDSGHRLSRQS